MARLVLPVLALLAALARATSAKVFESDHVLKLGRDFKERVSDGKVYFIKFYAPWCGHCKTLAPTWKQLAESFAEGDSIAIAHIDCTSQKKPCEDADVRGYPTLKVFQNGAEVSTYKGSRDLASLKAFIEEETYKLQSETTE
ncbi:hypothetical protein WJX81_008033 [Elliptochloris bilobata]|uniref:Thioredoxin domain-containing protein n=1 Tax=Elliptochloris bilobata TaxID=381761 RepID=A0AAW1QJW9_9CHLO